MSGPIKPDVGKWMSEVDKIREQQGIPVGYSFIDEDALPLTEEQLRVIKSTIKESKVEQATAPAGEVNRND